MPNFSDVWNLYKFLYVAFLMTLIYTFNQAGKASLFYVYFINNIKNGLPFISLQMLLLILFAKWINNKRPVRSIFLLMSLNLISVTFAYYIHVFQYFNEFSLDALFSKIIVSECLLFLFIIYFDWKEKNLHPSQLKAKLSFLQSKMRPHFLFNTMSSIIILIKREPDTAKKMLLNLSELLRASLRENDDNFMASIENEVILCKKYLEIEKIRLGERLKVEWDVQDDVLLAQIPSLTIQPLLENSVLHGIQHMTKGGIIQIKIYQLDDRLQIVIANNKEENFQKTDKYNNISTSNIKERLKLCFDGDVDFIMEDKKTEYQIKIDIPLYFDKIIEMNN